MGAHTPPQHMSLSCTCCQGHGTWASPKVISWGPVVMGKCCRGAPFQPPLPHPPPPCPSSAPHPPPEKNYSFGVQLRVLDTSPTSGTSTCLERDICWSGCFIVNPGNQPPMHSSLRGYVCPARARQYHNAVPLNSRPHHGHPPQNQTIPLLCVTDHSSGRTEEWGSVTPTRGATPKRGKTLPGTCPAR